RVRGSKGNYGSAGFLEMYDMSLKLNPLAKEEVTMRNLIQVVGVIAVLFVVVGAGPARPEVPDSLKAPAGEDVILSAHATGVQIYVCQAETEQKSAWVLKGPEAELTDLDGKIVVHHAAGPTWKHVDGSEVTGKVIAKQD